MERFCYRLGHQHFTATQLKVLQEAITLLVFCVFPVLYLKEELRWNYLVGFVLVLAAVFFVFGFNPPRKQYADVPPPQPAAEVREAA